MLRLNDLQEKEFPSHKAALVDGPEVGRYIHYLRIFISKRGFLIYRCDINMKKKLVKIIGKEQHVKLGDGVDHTKCHCLSQSYCEVKTSAKNSMIFLT